MHEQISLRKYVPAKVAGDPWKIKTDAWDLALRTSFLSTMVHALQGQKCFIVMVPTFEEAPIHFLLLGHHFIGADGMDGHSGFRASSSTFRL